MGPSREGLLWLGGLDAARSHGRLHEILGRESHGNFYSILPAFIYFFIYSNLFYFPLPSPFETPTVWISSASPFRCRPVPFGFRAAARPSARAPRPVHVMAAVDANVTSERATEMRLAARLYSGGRREYAVWSLYTTAQFKPAHCWSDVHGRLLRSGRCSTRGQRLVPPPRPSIRG